MASPPAAWPAPRDAVIFPLHADCTPEQCPLVWYTTIVEAMLGPTSANATMSVITTAVAPTGPDEPPADSELGIAVAFVRATMPRMAPFLPGQVVAYTLPPTSAFGRRTGVLALIGVAVRGRPGASSAEFDEQRFARYVAAALAAAREHGCRSAAMPLLLQESPALSLHRILGATLLGSIQHARGGGLDTVYLGTWAKSDERRQQLAVALRSAWEGGTALVDDRRVPTDRSWRMASLAACTALWSFGRRRLLTVRLLIAMAVLATGIAGVLAPAVDAALAMVSGPDRLRPWLSFALAAVGGTVLPAFAAFDATATLVGKQEKGDEDQSA
ncbi:MAG: hypothetical protein IPK26_13205 [Planctomycetes bacterium]|nr:hypothetical protein [Planctomycetota bacterium]